MKVMFCLALISLQVLVAVLGAPAEDLVTSLPGVSHLPSYKQYSGYLTASETKHFHYW